MNDPAQTRKTPARATALLLVGLGLVAAIAAMPTAAALAKPGDKCYADFVGSVATQSNTCGACRPDEQHYWSVGNIWVIVGPVTVYVPYIVWWNQCGYHAYVVDPQGLPGAVPEGIPLPTGG